MNKTPEGDFDREKAWINPEKKDLADPIKLSKLGNETVHRPVAMVRKQLQRRLV